MERIDDLIRTASAGHDTLSRFARWCAERAHRADMSVDGARLAARAASDASRRAAAGYSAAAPNLAIFNAIDAASYARAAAALSAGRCIDARDDASKAEHNAQRDYLRAIVAR
jgi:hypothetical protein